MRSFHLHKIADFASGRKKKVLAKSAILFFGGAYFIALRFPHIICTGVIFKQNKNLIINKLQYLSKK